MQRYTNREISWLSFNERVLQEAEDKNNPLLERVRFLGIFSNNQDEFFRVRVASMRRLKQDKNSKNYNLNFEPEKLLKDIADIVLTQQIRFRKIYAKLIKSLEQEQIFIKNEKQLNPEQEIAITNYFRQKVRPLLVPIMFNNVVKMHKLLDHRIYLAVILKADADSETEEYALIEIPNRLPRFFELPKTNNASNIILIDDIIRYCMPQIFNIFQYNYFKAYTLKITRDAELDLSPDLRVSYLEKIADSVKARKKAAVLRFVYDEQMPVKLLNYLTRRMKIKKSDHLIPGGRYHNFKDFMNFPVLGRTDLIYAQPPPIQPKNLDINESHLDYIKQKDLLLFYPYHSFNFMIELLREAAIDRRVKSIKITLYRVAQNSMIINALINAAQNGKEVTVVMEIRARFDELSNIEYANKLQSAGIRVIFADPNLKVHCKLCLINRLEGDEIIQYANVTNGNYHEGTSKQYSDLSLFTTDTRITDEANKLFKFMKHIIRTYPFEHLIVSPRNMKKQFYDLIDTEIENKKNGKEAWMKFKMNNFSNFETIDKLYEASNKNVKIQLLTRGICCLNPGVKGLSENIEVLSILDKYLEHSRFYIFANGGDPKIFLASADLMSRNLNDRIEVMCPVYDEDAKQMLLDIFDIQWTDNVKARKIDAALKNEHKKNELTKNRSQFTIYEYLKNRNLAD